MRCGGRSMSQSGQILQAAIVLLASVTVATGYERPYIKYSYRDSHKQGPLHWDTLRGSDRTKNLCKPAAGESDENVTPLNIQQEQATLPVRNNDEVELEGKKPSLTAYFNDGIEQIPWELGYPMDTYSGYEIRGPRMGLIQVVDEYDDSSSLNYDFNCAFISYCDYSGVGEHRSSHQIDGTRYPLEVNMLFFSEPRDIGIDMNYPPHNNNSRFIMISVLGEISPTDSESLEPLVKAAEDFNELQKREDAGVRKVVQLSLPFSPTWLFPDGSSGAHYYYYTKGNFPVPSCFPIAEVYVFKDTIQISANQLSRLTGFRSQLAADQNERISCTHGVLRKGKKASQVYYNPFPFKMVGRDNKPVPTDSKTVQIIADLTVMIIACCVLCLGRSANTIST